MCIICVSPRGVAQPDEATIRTMFKNNPDMAGYMVARKKSVEIHKGYVDVNDLIADLHSEAFTADDVVVYHFRISTQGFALSMSQPFPVTANDVLLHRLDVSAHIGVAHNGIIKLTSNGDVDYSDTALYVKDYVAPYINAGGRITGRFVNTVEKEAGGKLAFLEAGGRVTLTGDWMYRHGLFFSNDSYKERPAYYYNYSGRGSYDYGYKKKGAASYAKK